LIPDFHQVFRRKARNFLLFRWKAKRYECWMEQLAARPSRILFFFAVAGFCAVAIGAAFAGWLKYESTIVLTLSESGLSSCL